MDEIVYFNGYLSSRWQAGISAWDYGFLYGFGLFETMRAYKGRVFRLDSHLNRMARSAKVLGLAIEPQNLKEAVAATIEANNLSDARVRITVSAGEGDMTANPATCTESTVLITAVEYKPYPKQVYDKGFSAITSSIRRNSKSPLSRIKSTNYAESLLARQEARAAGVDEAICLNDKGLLAEASMSNVFLVEGSNLRTPGEENGILPGITREVVLELASKLGINTLEHNIEMGELGQADEAFLTNSLIEIMPLTQIDGKAIGSGRPGHASQRLAAEYKKLVAKT